MAVSQRSYRKDFPRESLHSRSAFETSSAARLPAEDPARHRPAGSCNTHNTNAENIHFLFDTQQCTRYSKGRCPDQFQNQHKNRHCYPSFLCRECNCHCEKRQSISTHMKILCLLYGLSRYRLKDAQLIELIASSAHMLSRAWSTSSPFA